MSTSCRLTGAPHIFQPLCIRADGGTGAFRNRRAPPARGEAEERRRALAEVKAINPAARAVEVICPGVGSRKFEYDFLVVATGMRPSYFGHDEFARFAPGLKTLNDAETIRTRILSAFELAESTDDEKERARQMTFVLVGAGPTGVELAASIAQLVSVTLRGNFRNIDPARSRILLLDGGARVLPTFAESLSKKAARRLKKLGVEVVTGVKVDKVDDQGVISAGERIPSATVLWTAGVAASPVVKLLGTTMDRAGRALVGPFLEIPEARDVFVVGDAAAMTQDGHPVPGVAQAALQQGRLGRDATAPGRKDGPPVTRTRHMAVVGKNFAVLEAGWLRTGALTWLVGAARACAAGRTGFSPDAVVWSTPGNAARA
jgi:NADH dehydrogenase